MARRNLERIQEEEQDALQIREIRNLTQEDVEEILKKLDEEFPVPKTPTNTESSDNDIEHSSLSPKLLDTSEKFEFLLEYISPAFRLKRGFEKGIHDAQRYYEHGLKEEPPSLILEIEERVIFFLYELFHNERPRVQIDSIRDIDRLLIKYPEEKLEQQFQSRYRKSKIYFQIRKDTSKSQKELASLYGIRQGRVSDYKSGIETTLISRLRRYEETRIIKEWTEKTLGRLTDNEKLKLLEKYINSESDNDFDLRASSKRHILRFEQSIHSEGERFCSSSDITEMITSSAFDLYRKMQKTKSRIAYIEYTGMNSIEKELAEKDQTDIEDGLKKKADIEVEKGGIRIGVMDNRLYLWTPHLSPNNMLNVWSKQIFHFRTRDLSRIYLEVGKLLQIHQNGYEQLRHFNKIANQMISMNKSDRVRIGKDTSRIMGEILHLACDVLGVSPRSIEGRIVTVTGRNGKGGISQPRLLEGEEVEISRARLGAIINSDCWLGSDGRLQYTEANRRRIEIVANLFRIFGGMSFKLIPNEENNSMKMWVPRPIGNSFIYWGFTTGEKSVKNEGLPSLIKEGSLKSYIAYLEELISEDGCFDLVSGFRWSRTIVLNLGVDDGDYIREPELSKEAIAFLEKFKHARQDAKGNVYIPIGKLDKYSKKLSGQSAIIAQDILSTVKQNRSKLLDDEVSLATKLGISIVAYPEYITIYADTKRISLKWVAKTRSKDDAIRWALIAPPNDRRKNSRVQRWLASIPKDANRIKVILQLENI